MSTPERLIPFETLFNFRDLGGYPAADGRTVRWRTLFRADGLNRLREEERHRFIELGITTVIDLRTPAEVEAGRFSHESVGFHHLPMFDVMPNWQAADPDAEGYLASRYVEMLESGTGAVATTLRLLAEAESYPLVFHCAAGKDRTGIVAAITLALLGVPDDVIVADYAASHEAMERLMAWATENQGTFARPENPVPSSAVAAHPATMERFLDLIRESHGSVEGLVVGLGVDPSVTETIRSILLE